MIVRVVMSVRVVVRVVVTMPVIVTVRIARGFPVAMRLDIFGRRARQTSRIRALLKMKKPAQKFI